MTPTPQRGRAYRCLALSLLVASGFAALGYQIVWAYDPLLRMGAELAHIDASAARTLLTELHQTQPSRLEAAQVLRELSRASP